MNARDRAREMTEQQATGNDPLLEPFQPFRVGDAVASRNSHAAIYDSLGLCEDM